MVAKWIVALFAALAPSCACAADLLVVVDRIEPGPGHIRVVLYRDKDTFRHEDRAFAVLSGSAASTTVQVEFRGVPPGRYAIIAYHDANDNHKLDLILGMFPDEGWGLSNDPTVIGPPGYEESAFTVGRDRSTHAIHLHY